MQADAVSHASQIDNEIPYHLNESNYYLGQFVPYFNLVLHTQEEFPLVQLFRYFEVDNNVAPYIYATQSADGYDYNITLQNSNSYQASTGTGIATQISIVNLVKKFHQSSALIIPFLYQNNALWNPFSSDKDKQTFLIQAAGDQKMDTVFLAPFRQLTTEINQKDQQINNLESRIKLVAQGVSIVAIATILSGIMVNRINDRKSSETLNQIRKTLNIIQEVPEQKKELISLPVLLIAGILSIFGLLIPLLI